MRRKSASRPRSLVTDARAVVETCIGGKTRLAARRVTQFVDRRLEGSGLSLAQFWLMAQVASAADDRLGALAERTGLDQSTLSRNLRSLEKAGLVEITRVESDLRRRAVWLTEQGAIRLEAAMPLWRAANRVLAQVLDTDQLETLGEAVSSLAGGEHR